MLQPKYTKKEDIPQGMESLYTEKDGAWLLTGVAGMKLQEDVDKVMGGLTKERDEHKSTKDKLRVWEGLERATVDAQLAKLAELEVVVQGSVPKAEMDKKLDELTEVRVKNRTMPIERERDTLKTQLAEAQKVVAELRAKETRRAIHDKVRAAAVAAKTLPQVEGDILLLADNVFQLTEGGELLTKENEYGITAGMSVEVFFQEQQDKRPYWWPPAVGGGAKGSGGGGGGAANPWSADSWNVTAQGKYVQEHGMEKAQQLARLAGSVVGGTKPAPRKQ